MFDPFAKPPRDKGELIAKALSILLPLLVAVILAVRFFL